MICAALAVVLSPFALPQGIKPPVRVRADGHAISVPEPGYASPAFHDVDGDGHGDLIVGQFDGGKLHVYLGDGKGVFRDGGFVMVGDEPAKIPGIW